MKSKEEQTKNWRRIQNESKERYSKKHRAGVRQDKQRRPNGEPIKNSIGKEHEETKRIRAAKRKALEEHGNICWSCGNIGVDPSHLLKTYAPYIRWKPDNWKDIIPQCRICHSKYELLNPCKRAAYWGQHGFPNLEKRILYLIGEIN